MEFNNGQKRTIQTALDFFYNSSNQVFEFAGNPGTGKSVVMGEILRQIQNRSRIPIERIAPMAYTGAASIVMRLKGLPTARTIHSWMYETVEEPLRDQYGNIVMDTYLNVPIMTIKFYPRQLKGKLDIILIDEGGMVPSSMLKEILNSGAKIFVAGDLDQLPPVADQPAFLTNPDRVHVLTEIMRQSEGSGIIYLSQRVKNGLPIHEGYYGDVIIVNEDEIQGEYYNNLIKASHVILCGKNSTRDRLNNYVRRNIKGIYSPLPRYGEKLICRKNNWALESGGINLTNGLTGTVINDPDVSNYDGKQFRIDFMPDLAPNSTFLNVPVSYRYIVASKEGRDTLKRTGHISGNLFEYGYAQTVHLAQGSQWENGIYFEEYLNKDINNRVHYTALTRFSKKCIYVKQKRKYNC